MRRYARAELRVLDGVLAPASILLWELALPSVIERSLDHCHEGGTLLET